MTEKQNLYWRIVQEELRVAPQERCCVFYQAVTLDVTSDDNTEQRIYGYYDTGIIALFKVDPRNVDFDDDIIYEFESADCPVWNGCMFPADNLHNGDCDFYSWEEAELLDAIVRLHDINLLKRHVVYHGILHI